MRYCEGPMPKFSLLVLLLCVMVFPGGTFAKTSGKAKNVDAVMAGSDREFLLSGVQELVAASTPGPLCAAGEQTAVLLAGSQDKISAPLAVAAKFGKGRVVAFGHADYLDGKYYDKTEDGKRFLKNMFRWLAQENPSPRIAVVKRDGFAKYLYSLGCNVQTLDGLTDPKAKGRFNILVIETENIPKGQIDRMQRFVSNGGAILAASRGWTSKQNLKTEHTGNMLFAPMGIAWMNGYLYTAGMSGGNKIFVVPPKERAELMNAVKAIGMLQKHDAKKAELQEDDLALALRSVENAIRSFPSEHIAQMGDLKSLLKRPVIIGPKQKLKRTDRVLDALAVTLQTEFYLKQQQSEVATTLLRSANLFPGAVPPNAKPVEKIVEIDTKIPGWHSLGLYAPPGGTVVVEPEENVPASGIGVRVGCHKDGLSGQTEWSRFPEITIERPLNSSRTEIRNPFGGLVYISVSKNDKPDVVRLKISGCIESPLYVDGQTSVEDWKQSIRKRPGPWGELASDRLILTLRSEILQALDNPDEVMEFWNKVLDSQAELSGRPLKRERPERMVCDAQISAGYMHAGYPVMTQMDVEKRFVDLDTLKTKAWGFFHELGHNHQSGDWTFGGTGEVTVNLFTLYSFEVMYGMKVRDHFSFTAESSKKKRDAHFAAGSPLEKWKSDAFLALTMYVDLIDEFGWEPFKNVFREYRTLSDKDRPKNDDEKRDQWMVRMSRELKKDLGPFFDRWGVPVSQAAKNSIKDLPAWNPY